MYSFTDDRFCLSKQCRRWSNVASGSALFAKILLLKPIVDKGLIMSANNLVVLLTLSTLKSSEAIPRKVKVRARCVWNVICVWLKKVSMTRKWYNHRPQDKPPPWGKHRPLTATWQMKCLGKSFQRQVTSHRKVRACERACVRACVRVCVSEFLSTA